MKKIFCVFLIASASLFFWFTHVSAHCEIPCGIYDDEMRIKMMLEHISTIEKSMNQIIMIENDKSRHSNQLIRWVMNKEAHADAFQHIVSQYFMTQRIKLDAKDYAKKIQILHRLLIYGMKCKQTTDLGHVKKLRNLVIEFQDLYFK